MQIPRIAPISIYLHKKKGRTQMSESMNLLLGIAVRKSGPC